MRDIIIFISMFAVPVMFGYLASFVREMFKPPHVRILERRARLAARGVK